MLTIELPFRDPFKDYAGISALLKGKKPGKKVWVRAYLRLKIKGAQTHSVWQLANQVELTLEDVE